MIFREVGTFGIRVREQSRYTLDRTVRTVNTPYGGIRIKAGTWDGVEVSASPEYEDCKRAAIEHGVSVRAVYQAAQRAEFPFINA